MKKPSCPEFDEWLERIPRRELSPAFRRHLEICEECRRSYEELKDVVHLLHEEEAPAPLPPEMLSRMAASVRRTAAERTKTRLIRKLVGVGAFCFPLIVAINGLWAVLGYRLLAGLSPTLAFIYVIFLAVAASFMAAMLIGSLPLLAAWSFKGYKEKTS
ncbi:MAG: hypothetical protein JXB26_07675 [Candidatus Aminicenantes bacterium]|nr:hypothetical protein [Candidatus Aminicenantes bacterium]